MQGQEVAHCNATISAVLAANNYLLQTAICNVLEPVQAYGKEDTLDMDARAESTIREQLRRHDRNAPLITEESSDNFDRFSLASSLTYPLAFFSDPTDRSSQLFQYFNQLKDQSCHVSEVVGNPAAIRKWEKSFGKPAITTGATTAVTALLNGQPICSSIINYITQDMFVICAAGARCVKLPKRNQQQVDLEYVLTRGKAIEFPRIIDHRIDRMSSFTTFIGKSGYAENLLASGLMTKESMNQHLHYSTPGGPSRLMYLSSLQGKDNQLGFIVANGEKIGEWIHWLPYVRYMRLANDQDEPALRMYEVSLPNSLFKKGILMAPAPPYSPFDYDREGRFSVSTERLAMHDDPSIVRATIIVTRRHNREVRRLMDQHDYRQIRFT